MVSPLRLLAVLFLLCACSGASIAPVPGPQAERGRLLFLASCTACHSLEGEPGGGPSLKGLPGSRIEVRDATGKLQILTADDAYLIRAIIAPQVELREPWPASMPTWNGSPEELQDLLAFLKEHFSTQSVTAP